MRSDRGAMFRLSPRFWGACLIAVAVLATACDSPYYYDDDEDFFCGGDLRVRLVNPFSNHFRGDAFEAEGYWDGANVADCPTNFNWGLTGNAVQLHSTTGPFVTGTALEPGTSRLTASVAEFSSFYDFEVVPTRFTIGFQGLPQGSPLGSLTLTGPGNSTYLIDGPTTITDASMGSYTGFLNEVTFNQHRYRGPSQGLSFELGRDTDFQLIAAYNRYTAQVDFSANGVPSGFTGSFGSFDNDGQTFPITSSQQTFVFEPGPLAGVYVPVDPGGFDFQPPFANFTTTLLEGEDRTLNLSYTALRGRADFFAPGLASGAFSSGTISGAGGPSMVDVPGSNFFEPGNFGLTVSQVINYANLDAVRLENFVPVNPFANFSITAGQVADVSTPFERSSYTYRETVQYSIRLDSHGHHGFVFAARPTWVDLHVDESGGGATFPVSITGPTGWVPLFGSLTAGTGVFSASGTGTVAGFSNVPVTLDGMLFQDGSIDAVYQLGSDVPPTGLPNGSIQYDWESTAFLNAG